MSKIINTIRKHAIIDNAKGNGFSIEGLTPTRTGGRWVEVTKADRLVLISSAVSALLETKDVSGAKGVIESDERKGPGGKPSSTYRKRLEQKMADVNQSGGEGLATLKADWKALKAELTPQLTAKTSRKPARKSTKASSPSPVKKVSRKTVSGRKTVKRASRKGRKVAETVSA